MNPKRFQIKKLGWTTHAVPTAAHLGGAVALNDVRQEQVKRHEAKKKKSNVSPLINKSPRPSTNKTFTSHLALFLTVLTCGTQKMSSLVIFLSLFLESKVCPIKVNLQVIRSNSHQIYIYASVTCTCRNPLFFRQFKIGPTIPKNLMPK